MVQPIVGIPIVSPSGDKGVKTEIEFTLGITMFAFRVSLPLPFVIGLRVLARLSQKGGLVGR